MCKTWGGSRIQIGIKMESRIRIRIDIKTMPIHNTAFNRSKSHPPPSVFTQS